MYIDSQGNRWYKGNLHTHTTVSDGRVAPLECMELYKDKGYDFLAITDHWAVSEQGEYKGMLLLSGCEYNIGVSPKEGVFHIVGVGMEHKPALTREQIKRYTPQELIDGINAVGGAAFLAHPAWSLNRVSDCIKLRDIVGVEIFNTASDLPHNARPYSGCFVDLAAVEGVYYNNLATDDSHWYENEHCHSYIMVKADELTQSAITAALKAGDFYATQAPNYSYTINGDTLTVTTTPAKQVSFLSDSVWANDRVTTAKDGSFITTASYKISSIDTFVRFEITDLDGNLGWSNVIKVER